MKPVLNVSSYIHQRTWFHSTILWTDLDEPASTYDVIYLIFGMWFLEIYSISWQHVQTYAEGRDTQKFEVGTV